MEDVTYSRLLGGPFLICVRKNVMRDMSPTPFCQRAKKQNLFQSIEKQNLFAQGEIAT